MAVTLLTGIALMWRRGMTPNRLRWMAAKLALAALITLNGAFILTPLAADIAAAAEGAVGAGNFPASFASGAERGSFRGRKSGDDPRHNRLGGFQTDPG